MRPLLLWCLGKAIYAGAAIRHITRRKCRMCSGRGTVADWDGNGGGVYDTCPRCDGTGREPRS
jgi:DnaJ-class molecular chaperone